MKGYISIFLVFLFLSVGLFADWKTTTAGYLNKVQDYESLISFLSNALKNSSNHDAQIMYVILGYCYSNLGNPESERFWIKKKFSESPEYPLLVDFFSDKINLDITEYWNNWIEKFPYVKELQLPISSFPYKQVPSSIQLSLLSNANAFFKLYRNNSLIREGTLVKGSNTIEIPGVDLLATSNGLADLSLEVSAAGVSIKKSLLLLITVDKPEDIVFSDHGLSIKNKAFQPETKTETLIITKSYFDSNHFSSKSLPLFACGLGAIVADLLFVKKKLDDSNFSHSSEPIYDAAHKTLMATGIALSAKGIWGLIKSFKKSSESVDKSSPDKTAIDYNNYIRSVISQAESKVVFHLSVSWRDL
jgi:hypothetical protein